MPAGPASRPWRRYLRLSVRGLIVLVLVSGVWLGWVVRSARIQREAVVAIERAVGDASYDWEYRNGDDFPGGKPWAPRWLVDLIGVDYFGHVTSVSLNGKPPDSAIVQVGRLSRLQVLDLDGSSVSDVGLAHLKGLTSLTKLDLMATQVTDAGMAHLKGLTNLSSVRVGDTQVSDAGLAHLKGLTNLSVLELRGTQVTDAGLAHLKGLTELFYLDLSGTQVSDAGLAHLKGLVRLSALDLRNTRVTHRGVKALRQTLPSLKIAR